MNHPPPDLTLVAGALLLADPGASAAPAPADVLIEGGQVRAIAAAGALDTAGARHRIDARDHLLMPGLVNAHTHAHGALGRGAVADVALEGFLAASPSINGQRSTEDLALSATLSAVEQLQRGCTAAFDVSGEWPRPTLAGLHAVAGAYAAVGLRAVVAPMLADRSLFQAFPDLLQGLPDALRPAAAAVRTASAADQLAVVRAAVADWPFDPAQVRLGVAPTIPLHCSDELLQGCAALSLAHGLPLQTHLAESRAQAVSGLQRHGCSLVAHLARLGVLSPRFSAAHAVWIDDADMALLAAAGATVVHNPLSNLRLGSGIAPVRRMLDAGLRVALGTDGANTADTQNLFEAARLATGLSRVVDADESRWIGAATALAMATRHSAHALGWGDRLGVVEAGRAADLLLVDLRQAHFVPLRDPVRQLVHGECGVGVATVLVGGRTVVERGRVTTVDEAALRRRAQAAADRLDAMNADGRGLAQALRPWVSAYCCGMGPRVRPGAPWAAWAAPGANA